MHEIGLRMIEQGPHGGSDLLSNTSDKHILCQFEKNTPYPNFLEVQR